MSDTVLELVRADIASAMKAGERERVGVLRMLANALQAEHKEGSGDETGVLRRERKRRLEAARAFREGGEPERAASEEAEAETIAAYLPAELEDAELDRIVSEAISEAGAQGPGDMGRVMSIAMPRVGDRAEGRRVSEAVRARLGS